MPRVYRGGFKKFQSVSISFFEKEDFVTLTKNKGLFIAIGRIPENQNFEKIIKMDKAGYIIAGENCNTNIPGIFVAGDNRTKEVRQLVTATSDGAVSATEAIKYINNK
jgi:thioredoxin reductase (NADPH)